MPNFRICFTLYFIFVVQELFCGKNLKLVTCKMSARLLVQRCIASAAEVVSRRNVRLSAISINRCNVLAVPRYCFASSSGGYG